MRADKFLWSVRLFKTRKDATEACKDNKISIRNNAIKPGYQIKMDDVFLVKKGSLKNTFMVVGIPLSRVGAKLVSEYIQDITPMEDQEKNRLIITAKREDVYDGSGRPTKRDRRTLDKWNDGLHGLPPSRKKKK